MSAPQAVGKGANDQNQAARSKRLEEAKQQIADLKNQIDLKTVEIQQLTKTINEQAKKILKTENLTSENEELKTKIQQSKNLNQELINRIAEQTEIILAKESIEKDMMQQISRLEETIRALNIQLDETEDKNKDLTERVSEKNKIIFAHNEAEESLKGRVTELSGQLEEANQKQEALRAVAQQTEEKLTNLMNNQTHALIGRLKVNLEHANWLNSALDKQIESISGIIIKGNNPEEDFYYTLEEYLKEAQKAQEQINASMQDGIHGLKLEISHRNTLCDDSNAIRTSSKINETNMIYLKDLSGIPEQIRLLKSDLDAIQTKIKKLLSKDFQQSTPEEIKKIGELFEIQLSNLEKARLSFKSIFNSEIFNELFQRINSIANNPCTPIEDKDLEKYSFYTNEGKEETKQKLNNFAKLEHERYTALRSLLTAQWNGIVQQITELENECNLLALTLLLYIPLNNQSNELNQLGDDLRKSRKATSATTDSHKLNRDLETAKTRFLNLLQSQEKLNLLFKSLMNDRLNEASPKTLQDFIKDEAAYVNKHAELANSMKNKSAPEKEVDQALIALHDNIRKKYEDFKNRINVLWDMINDKGNRAAFELNRLEHAIQNSGTFTTEVYFSTLMRTSSSMPPYQTYWANPSEGIKNMQATVGNESSVFAQAV